MKINLKYKLLVGIFIFIMLVIICIQIIIKNDKKSASLNYLFAAFDTTVQKNDSDLIFYDKDFNEIYKKNIPIGGISDSFIPPLEFDEKIYVAPNGNWFETDCDEVLEFNKKTGNYISYKTNQFAVRSLAVSEKYIFTVNEWNGVTVLARINKDSKEIKEIKFEGKSCSQIDVYDNNLYFFISYEENDEENECNTSLYILDIDTMEITKNIDISEYGRTPEATCMKDGVLYMPIQYTKADEYCGLLLMYNTQNGEMQKIDLNHKSPSNILVYKDSILIIHTDLVGVSREEHSVTFYNPYDNTLKNYTLKNCINYAIVKDDTLYTLDSSENSVYIYKINKTKEPIFINKIKLKTKDGDTSENYYSGGFFTME